MANFVKPVRQSGIFCLEVPWDRSRDNIDETAPKSVLPGLQLIARYHGLIQLNYKTCATSAELRYHVRDFSEMNANAKRWYGCLYLASHGSKGIISLPGDDEELTIGQLAKLLGRSFKDCLIYFGSCSVLACSEDTLNDFVEETGVDAIVGYETDIDWIDSTVLDILFLNKFLDEGRPKSKTRFWNKFREEYEELVDKYNMVFFG